MRLAARVADVLVVALFAAAVVVAFVAGVACDAGDDEPPVDVRSPAC